MKHYSPVYSILVREVFYEHVQELDILYQVQFRLCHNIRFKYETRLYAVAVKR